MLARYLPSISRRAGLCLLVVLFAATPLLGQDLGGEPIWFYDANLRVAHVESADLNGDMVPDIIAAEYNNQYYGEPSLVYGLDGKTGDTIWTYQLQDGARSMAIGDINGDNVADVAVGASYNSSSTPDGYVHAINGVDGSQLWQYSTGATNQAVTVGDINGDQYMDVAVGSFDDYVHAINGQTGTAFWTRDIGSLWVNDVAIEDVDGDNIGDVSYAHEYLTGFDNFVGVLNGTDGIRIWEDTVDYAGLKTLFEDIDDDGNLDVIYGILKDDESIAVQVRNPLTGEVSWEASLGVSDGVNSDIFLFIADVDNDTDVDLLVGHGGISYSYTVFDGTSSTPMYTSPLLSGYARDMAFGDFTDDGNLDIAIASYDRVTVVDASDGTELWYYAVAGTIASVTAGDYDDDGVMDVGAGGTADASGTPPDPGKAVWAIKTSVSPLLWEFDFGEYGNAVAIGNFNGDSAMDVIAVASLGERAWAIDGANGTELWHWTGDNNLFAVVTGDFDNDGTDDAATGGYGDMVTALDGDDGGILWQFPDPSDDIYRKGLAAADLNEDNYVDIIVGCEDNTLYALSGIDGSVLWSNPYSADVEEVDKAQMNGVGGVDVVACIAGSTPRMVVLDGATGGLIWEYTTDIASCVHVEPLDANDDGVMDVAIGCRSATSKIVVVDGSTQIEMWTVTGIGLTGEYGLAHGDVNDDKAQDVIAGGSSSDANIYAFDGPTGGELWHYTTGSEVNTVMCHDLDGDDRPEVIGGSDDQSVYVLDPIDGSVKFEYACADDVMHLAIGDVSGNGAPNLVAITFGSDGIAYAFRSLYDPPQGCCVDLRGNIDGDPGESINIVDVTFLVAYLFSGGPTPPCLEEGNFDGDAGESINIVDVTALVAYLFNGGPGPAPCP